MTNTSKLYRIFAIFRRELFGFFISPVATIFLIIFLVLTGSFTFMPFLGAFFEQGNADLSPFFTYQPWLFLLLIPPLGMGVWAEEKRSGNIELLLTMPIRPMWAIVSKFFAAWAVIVVALLFTFPMVITVYWLGEPDLGPIFAGYIGCMLLAGAYLAIATFASAAFRSQISSFIFTQVILLSLLFIGFLPSSGILAEFPDWIKRFSAILLHFSTMIRFESMRRGVIDFRDVLFFLSLIFLGIFLTVLLLRKHCYLISTKKLLLNLFLVVGAIISVNVLLDDARLRWDMSEGKAFSLSAETLQIIDEIEEGKTIKLRFYLSENLDGVSPNWRVFARETKYFLKEYERAGKGKIKLELVDPKPFSQEEEQARLDGITEPPIVNGRPFYCNLVINRLDKRQMLDFPRRYSADSGGLDRNRVVQLEYDLSRSIAMISRSYQPIIGYISGIQGKRLTIGANQGTTPDTQERLFLRMLRQDYSLQPIPRDATAISPRIDLLVLVHPVELTTANLFAIDQYLLRGGKAIIFLDPFSYVSFERTRRDIIQRSSENADPREIARIARERAGIPSNLNKLLETWGINFSSEKVVADPQNPWIIHAGGREHISPTHLHLNRDQVAEVDIISADFKPTFSIDSLLLPFAGYFEGEPVAGLEKQTFLQTSNRSSVWEVSESIPSVQLDNLITQGAGENFASRDVGIVLKGKFPSAFKTIPEQLASETIEQIEHLKQASATSVVVLVADTDLLHEQFTLMSAEQVISQNLGFVSNLVDWLGGNQLLLDIRSRKSTARPLITFEKRVAEITENYQKKIEEITAEVGVILMELAAIEAEKEEQRGGVISTTEREKILKLRQGYNDFEATKMELQRQLHREVETIKTRIRLLNIFLSPFLVICLNVLFRIIRHFRLRTSTAENT